MKFINKLLLAFCIVLSGCTNSIGNTTISDEAKVASIRVGVSTVKDVEVALGIPGSSNTESNGEQVWEYQHVQTTPMAYIPFLNKGSMKEKNITIRFDKRGYVKAINKGQHSF